MKKTTISLFTLGALLFGATAPVTATQTIERETTATVPVNGIIGEFDPETDTGIEPPNSNDWIKVTVPTTAIFHSDAENNNLQTLTSPTYTVTNHSARGVNVAVSDVTNVVDPQQIIDNLSLVPNGQVGVNLITDGTADFANYQDGFTIFSLGAASTNTNSDTFTFSGSASDAQAGQEMNPSFDLVLEFSPILP